MQQWSKKWKEGIDFNSHTIKWLKLLSIFGIWKSTKSVIFYNPKRYMDKKEFICVSFNGLESLGITI